MNLTPFFLSGRTEGDLISHVPFFLPYDNAAMESFFSSLKQGLTHHQPYATREEASTEIFRYIEGFYNRQRLHSSLGYRSPEAFERLTNGA